jgi:hypothetical protein
MKLRRLFPLLLLSALSTASLAFGQTDTPVGDDADPDALARIAASDVLVAATGGQVLRSADHFVQDGHTFIPKGTNFELHAHPWALWGPNYYNQTAEVTAEVDRARGLGANVVRVFVTSADFGGVPASYGAAPIDPSGHVKDTALTQLDDFLARADARGLKVLLTLYDGLNIFRSVNGTCRGQIGNPYLHGESWDYQNTSPDWNVNTWYTGPDIRPFRHHADEILTKTIPNTNRVFANDPRIFGWDVMNEPDHLFNQPACTFYSKNYVNAWVGWMARHVRIYTQAPITAGTYGWFLNPADKDRHSINFTGSLMDYMPQTTPMSLWDDLDFISFHWYEPADLFASAVSATRSYLYGRIAGGKPVLVEEIGEADSGWYLSNSVCVQQSYPGCNAGLSCNRAWVHDWTTNWASTAKTYGVGTLVWTGSDFVRTGSCGKGETNGDFLGFYDGGGVLKPSGRAYALAGSDTSCTRAAFRTRDGLHWLTAHNGGGPGSSLEATGSGTSPGASSIFNLVRSGDSIGLKIAKNGVWYYVSAYQGGGSSVTVDQTQQGTWGNFGVVSLGYVSGFGDNAVAVRTSGYNGTPFYVSATNAGGSSVNAIPTTVLSWETFQMVCQSYTDDPADDSSGS